MSDESGRPVPLRYFEVSAQALLLALVTGNAFRVVDGIPSGGDAELVDCGYNPRRQLFYLTVQHPEFDPIHEGEEIPQGEATLRDLDLGGEGDLLTPSEREELCRDELCIHHGNGTVGCPILEAERVITEMYR